MSKKQKRKAQKRVQSASSYDLEEADSLVCPSKRREARRLRKQAKRQRHKAQRRLNKYLESELED